MSRFPPSGPTGCRSPSSSVLSRHYDFLPPVPRHFVAFVRRYHAIALVLSFSRGKCHHVSLELLTRYSFRDGRWRRQDLPSSWATPIVRLLMFFDSGEPVCSRPSFGAIAWPPLRERQRLSQRQDFRSSITWLSDSLRAPCGAWSASSRSLPYATQDSLPAVGQTLPDGLSTRRVTIEGFKFTSCQSSSSAKFLGAIPSYSLISQMRYLEESRIE